MANIKSQIKRNRQNERRRLQNKSVSSRVKTEVKRVGAAAESGDTDAARERLRAASQLIDKAASKRVLHKRAAARRKSRLARKVGAQGAAASQEA